ncbi:MAG: hypothetical protein J5614_00865, partial [Paludibacteraceae bacterium]|nr:hypothetical protein [Paludibacteraceae bacterium]
GNVPTIITVPDGYDEVEYVQSNGTQYIKTVAVTSVTDFECVCEITNTGGSQCIFGVGINSSDSAAYKRGLAVYAIYDPADPQSAFLCKDQVFMNGSTMPFNQKIKIMIKDNVLEWYDMSGQLLGSITATERSTYQSNEITLFDVSNGKSGSSLAPSGLYSTAKIYSFKRTVRSSGNISNYLVPCVNQSDPTQIGFYDLAGKTYYFKGGGDTFTCGQVVPKTEYMGTVSNTTNSRLSRFIIAGGGGGQGSPIGLGGDGGGEEGEECKGTATYGSNKGPGKRTSGSSFEVTTSGDAGGSSYVDSIKTYGGGGGYGWYSGYGTQNTVTVKMSSDDVNKGGSGGSSYVFSEETDQYKRSGYRVDTSYWMTDTKNILGGNPVRGMTRIEIEIESTSERVLSVMASDSDGYKAYDTEMNSWISLIDIDELTPEIFTEYGIALESIENDEGLSFPYKLYVYDPFDTGVNKIYSYVVPAQQRITFSNNCDVRRIRKYTIDGEFDEHVTAALNYELTDEAINTELLIDMSDTIEKDSFVCMVQY